MNNEYLSEKLDKLHEKGVIYCHQILESDRLNNVTKSARIATVLTEMRDTMPSLSEEARRLEGRLNELFEENKNLKELLKVE